MASFGNFGLTDYSNTAAAGAAFEGFAKALGDAQDKAIQRREHEAKLNAMQTQMEREKAQTQIEAFKNGLAPSATGGFEPRALAPRERAQNQLKAAGEGYKSTGTDELGYDTGYEFDPNSAKGKQIDASNGYKREGLDVRRDRMDRGEHQQVINAVNRNPTLKSRLLQYQNLENALSNLTNAEHITPQQFHEAQQSIRSNLGIKGTSGVDERSGTYLNSLGLKSDNWNQFLTGVPQDMKPNDPFLKHIKNLAGLEQRNARAQYQKALQAASGGHSSMYSRRPDLQADLEDAILRQEQQIGPAQGAQPTSLVQPKSALVPFGLGVGPHPEPQVPQEQAPAPHPQDAAAVQKAQAILNDKNARPEDHQKARMVLQLNGVQ